MKIITAGWIRGGGISKTKSSLPRVSASVSPQALI